MALEHYDDTDSAEMEGGGQEEMSQDATDSKGKTALVNSEICPGMAPGDTFTVRVDKVLDSGEYQISYPGEESKEEPEPSMEEGMAPQSEVASYME